MMSNDYRDPERMKRAWERLMAAPEPTGGDFWLKPGECPDLDQHRPPQGPCEDLGQCPKCYLPTFAMRPENETIGFHADDCSLPARHEGYCVGGGSGHPPAEVIRGHWPGMDEDIARKRAEWDERGTA